MISVVIPAYNAAEFIGRAIASVLSQTYQDFEIVVVDDASTDRTVAIVEAMAAADSRIRLIAKPDHSGISASANAGTEAARSNWVARLDADDVMLPTRIERQLAAANGDPEVIVWGTYAYQINRQEERLGTVEIGPTTLEEYEALVAAGNPIYLLNPTTIYRRDVVLEAGGYESTYDSAEDVEMWSRIQRRGPMRAIPEHLLLYRIHGKSITARKGDFQSRVFGFVKARNRAWLADGDLTFDEYQAQLAARPWIRRVRDQASVRARLYYRLAGVQLAERHYPSAAFNLVRAGACDPGFVVDKVRGRIRRHRWRR